MKHLELHVLQSFPVSCLNRDDLNSPKMAIFGGVQRARVSSQSWKRAIRELAEEKLPKFMGGKRTRLIVGALVDKLGGSDLPQSSLPYLAEIVAAYVSKLDTRKDSKGYRKVTTACFLSGAEFSTIAAAMAGNVDLQKAAVSLSQCLTSPGDDEDRKKKVEKTLKECEKTISKDTIIKAIKSVQLKDAADIALFGSMVANDHSLTVEAAAMFSHALSTHKVDNEIDYFSAVDDRQPNEESGAAITGTLEYNAATYYRFAALNLDMLKDKDHLGALSQNDRKEIVKAFVQATLEAVPKARKASMNGNVRPSYVLGVVRNSGHPIQLVNAFEKPVVRRADKGLVEVSIEELRKERDRLNRTWGLNANGNELMSKSIPDDLGLTDFLAEVLKYVD